MRLQPNDIGGLCTSHKRWRTIPGKRSLGCCIKGARWFGRALSPWYLYEFSTSSNNRKNRRTQGTEKASTFPPASALTSCLETCTPHTKRHVGVVRTPYKTCPAGKWSAPPPTIDHHQRVAGKAVQPGESTPEYVSPATSSVATTVTMHHRSVPRRAWQQRRQAHRRGGVLRGKGKLGGADNQRVVGVRLREAQEQSHVEIAHPRLVHLNVHRKR